MLFSGIIDIDCYSRMKYTSHVGNEKNLICYSRC